MKQRNEGKVQVKRTVRRAVWICVKDRLPELTKEQRKPGEFGVQVLIYPPNESSACAFFGTRIMDKPGFYLYGAAIKVTHWMPLPKPPLT